MSNVFKEFRKSRKLSQSQAGALIGASGGAWSKLEYNIPPQHTAKKYENAIKFINCNLFAEINPQKREREYFKPLTDKDVFSLTGFTVPQFRPKKSKNPTILNKVLLNAAILAIDEEKSKRAKNQASRLPKMEFKTYPAPSIAIIEKKSGSIVDQISAIESRNEELEGENAALKLTVSTLELQIQQLLKENELLKADANTDKSAPVTKEQREYLVSIVKRYLDKTKGKKVNDYFAKAFWTDIYEDVGPDVKMIDDIKTFNQWLAAVHSAKSRCKAIGLQIESFPVQLSIVS